MTNQAHHSIRTTARSVVLKPLAVLVSVLAVSACQTVDLGVPAMAEKSMTVPSCDVSPGDYKVLAYLQKGADAKKTTRITEVLKKKYADAAPIAGANPIMAVQSFVASKTGVSPTELQTMVTEFCKK